MVVMLDDIEVMCVVAPSMRGRKFYGATFDPENDYRACAAIQEGDEPNELGLETWTMPGGAYERKKIPNRPELIAGAFEGMMAGHPGDATRPSIEFYRSQREIILFWPVADEPTNTV